MINQLLHLNGTPKSATSNALSVMRCAEDMDQRRMLPEAAGIRSLDCDILNLIRTKAFEH